MNHRVRIYPDAETLAHAIAQHFVDLAGAATTRYGRFAVALPGGSTPRPAYHLLATEYAGQVDWYRVHVFWGDEHLSGPGEAGRSYHSAREMLFDHVPIPADHLYPIPFEQPPEQAADAYEAALRAFFAGRSDLPAPRFDLVLLGLGADGHTASLFPGSAPVNERERWVAAHHVDKLESWRVTLTPAAFNAAAQVTFIVSGEAKAAKLAEVLNAPFQPDRLPPQAIRPVEGERLWLADAQAAAGLAADREA